MEIYWNNWTTLLVWPPNDIIHTQQMIQHTFISQDILVDVVNCSSLLNSLCDFTYKKITFDLSLLWHISFVILSTSSTDHPFLCGGHYCDMGFAWGLRMNTTACHRHGTTQLGPGWTWSWFHKWIMHIFVWSHEVSKLRDLCLELCDRSESLQVVWQRCCFNLTIKPLNFETLWDLTILNIIRIAATIRKPAKNSSDKAASNDNI